LRDPNTIRRIVEAMGLNPEDRVLEIGSGRGALTGLLAKSCALVVALEKDRDLCLELKEKLPRAAVVNADA
jgi:16S rRNA (adenine1518-N6/adenine1519-N6)-dimethyltransferase